MINQLLHRAWLDDELPAAFAEYGYEWDRLHPDWTRVDWLHSHRLPRLHPASQSLVGRAHEIYPNDHKRFVADIVRLELVWRFGGVWVDTDVQPLRPIDELLTGVECFAGRSSQQVGGRHPITNAVFGASPRHPFIAACISALPEGIARYGRRSLAQSVGPWLLTRVYEQGDWPTVTIFDAETLYGGDWLEHKWNSDRRRRGVPLG